MSGVGYSLVAAQFGAQIQVKTLLSAESKRAAAAAYAHTVATLFADTSETAKRLIIEYLTNSLKLYKESDALADEAGSLILLGDASLRNLGRDSYELGELNKAQSALLDARNVANNAGAYNEYLADYL